MPKKTQPENPFEIPAPGTNPEIKLAITPEYLDSPEEEPDIIPEDDPREMPLPIKFRHQVKGLKQESKFRKT